VKLIAKQRIASKTIKKYDKPKTPFQRLLDSNKITAKSKAKLSALHKSLNPFLLQQSIKEQIFNILKLV